MVLAKVLFDNGKVVTVGAQSIPAAMDLVWRVYHPHVRLLHIAEEDETEGGDPDS